MKNLNRRTLLRSALACTTVGAFGAVAPPALAQSPYPSKPVRILVGFPPGGSTDQIARLLALEFSKTFSQQFVVDNKSGANGNIATAEVVRSQPSGHDLMFSISSHVTNGLLYPSQSYDSLRDITPIALVARSPFVLLAHPSFKANTIEELVAMAKANPKGINFASPGQGSTQHLAMELLMSMTGTQLTHIPYRGGAPATTDLLAGQVPLLFSTVMLAKPYLDKRQLKALGVTSTSRVEALPKVPTIAEAGVAGYESDVWFGLIGPRGLPAHVTSALYTDVTRMAGSAEFNRRLIQQGATADIRNPEKFAELLKQEVTKWGDLIRKHHITANS